MPAPDFTIKRGDTGPLITSTLTAAGGVPVDLTGATVRFHLAPVAGGVVTVDALATIVSPTLGTVRYAWQAADTATAGYYRAEWLVTFASGLIERVPNDGNLLVLVVDRVA